MKEEKHVDHSSIEDLTKSQLIMLALLVSFVTSIATGIVTVTLMDQAPTDVTRTINRVVERTVEKVVPGETKVVERIIKESPSESDQVVVAVSKSRDTIVRILGSDGSERTGFFVSSTGAILTSSMGMQADKLVDYEVRSNQATTTLAADLIVVDPDLRLAILKVPSPIDDTKVKPDSFFSFLSNPPTTKGGYDNLAITSLMPDVGERLIVMGQDSDLDVTANLGTASMVKVGSASSSPVLITNIASNASLLGGPVLDVSGALLGVFIGERNGQSGVVIPGKAIILRWSKQLSQDSNINNTANVGAGL